MSKYGEPWKLVVDGVMAVENSNGEWIIVNELPTTESRENFSRLVACVNSCRHLKTEVLKHLHLGELMDQCITAERDEYYFMSRNLKRMLEEADKAAKSE